MIEFFYYRSLYSQSASSLSVAKFSSYLLSRGYETKINLMSLEDYGVNMKAFESLKDGDTVIYKVNYKDFDYGIELFRNLKETHKNLKLILAGPFAILNRDKIEAKYDFVDEILDIQLPETLDERFKVIGSPVQKDTVICGIDRETEAAEKGAYINVESSTGCVNHCSFCHINLTKQKFSNKDMKDVVEEMYQLNKKFGKTYFIFNDSMFYKGVKDDERVIEFCNLIKEKKMKVYFYIYLAIQPQIPEHLLDMLVEAGLVRVFVGVESITGELQINNKKNVSEESADKFLKLLSSKGVSYHIGFMLFYPEIALKSVKVNVDYLHKIKKLFRIGILIEKMRILRFSPNSNILYEDDIRVDQVYNYHFYDKETEKVFNVVKEYFSHINERHFEQYLTGYNIAVTVIKREGKEKQYKKYIENYNKMVDESNDFVYEKLLEIIKTKTYTREMVIALKNLQYRLEAYYSSFMNELKKNDEDIFKIVPLGKEDLNLWK